MKNPRLAIVQLLYPAPESALTRNSFQERLALPERLQERQATILDVTTSKLGWFELGFNRGTSNPSAVSFQKKSS